jgi:hypothetical protein
MGIRSLAAAVVCLCLAGCGTSYAYNQDDSAPPAFACLRSGVSHREDLLAELGEPHRTFPRDRIAMWRMRPDGGRLLIVAPGHDSAPRGRMTLVAEFDADDVLRRWSLVDQR